jgi:AcrR family transcriptional regulator
LNHAAVVSLALDVIDEHGFDGLTLAAVASRAGVAVPSLYKHVDGLSGLRRDVAQACADDYVTIMKSAENDATEASSDPSRTLRSLANRTRSYALVHPGRYEAAWSGIRRGAEAADQVVAEAVTAAGVDPRHRTDAARALRAGVYGFVALELVGDFGRGESIDASFDYLVDLLVDGVIQSRDRATFTLTPEPFGILASSPDAAAPGQNAQVGVSVTSDGEARAVAVYEVAADTSAHKSG